MPIEICFKPLDGGKEAENRLIEADEDGEKRNLLALSAAKTASLV
jgi:hypothetical protein